MELPRILAFDITPYLPLAASLALNGWLFWGYAKSGRRAHIDDIERPLRKQIADVQQTNSILENQNGVLKQKDAEREKELNECEKKCSEVTRFNFRLQGEIDGLERRVSELEGGDIHTSKSPHSRRR